MRPECKTKNCKNAAQYGRYCGNCWDFIKSKRSDMKTAAITVWLFALFFGWLCAAIYNLVS